MLFTIHQLSMLLNQTIEAMFRSVYKWRVRADELDKQKKRKQGQTTNDLVLKAASRNFYHQFNKDFFTNDDSKRRAYKNTTAPSDLSTYAVFQMWKAVPRGPLQDFRRFKQRMSLDRNSRGMKEKNAKIPDEIMEVVKRFFQ